MILEWIEKARDVATELQVGASAADDENQADQLRHAAELLEQGADLYQDLVVEKDYPDADGPWWTLDESLEGPCWSLVHCWSVICGNVQTRHWTFCPDDQSEENPCEKGRWIQVHAPPGP